MSLVRVQGFSNSLDGFGAGEGQSDDAHFGHVGERVHERGPKAPFHTPAWGLTRQLRPSIVMKGGTTFPRVDASPTELLEVPDLPPQPDGPL